MFFITWFIVHSIASIGQSGFAYDVKVLVRYALVNHTNCVQDQQIIQIPFVHLLFVWFVAFDVDTVPVIVDHTKRELGRRIVARCTTRFVVCSSYIPSGSGDLSMRSARRRGNEYNVRGGAKK